MYAAFVAFIFEPKYDRSDYIMEIYGIYSVDGMSEWYLHGNGFKPLGDSWFDPIILSQSS